MEAMGQPYPLLIEILEARAFAASYDATRSYKGDDGEQPPSGELVDLVHEFTRDDVLDAVARRAEQLGEA